jgi:hypothetical protein
MGTGHAQFINLRLNRLIKGIYFSKGLHNANHSKFAA